MWWKLVLLSVYLLLVLVVSRILETVAWYSDDGRSSLAASVIVDPFALSVRTLKQVLENRGVSYVGILEKYELGYLVESSGQTSESEIAELEGRSDVPEAGEKSSTHFTCGSHFYEEVEDKKDSIWLVQVISADGYSLFSDSAWKELTSKITKFDVRTGVFDCSLDRRMCSRRGWFSSRIMLALPSTNFAKQDVALHQYTGRSIKLQAIVNWIRMHLGQRVTKIKSVESLKKEWLTYKETDIKSVVRVVFVTSQLPEPPLFMSALSVKFSGRVKFGMIKANKSSLNQMPCCKKLPAYLIITPESMHVFGERQGEIFAYNSLELFLRSLTPEMNDMFIFSVLIVNLVTTLELFLIRGKVWKHFIRSMWNIARNNCLLFLLWLLVFGLLRFDFLRTVLEFVLTVVRTLGCSDVASFVRREWRIIQTYPLSLSMSFMLFCLLSGWVWQKCKRQGAQDDSIELFDWLTGPIDSYIMNCFFRPMATLTRPMVPQDMDLEEGMELLIERLAVPNLWLQPMISNDYIKDLPTWKYMGWCSDDDFMSSSSSSETSSDEDFINNQYHKTQPKVVDDTKRTAEHQPETKATCNSDCKVVQRAPLGVIECRECSICLEKYRYGVELCSLPCGHSYHINCILMWLSRDNHCCPVCRWPSYKPKLISSARVPS